MSKNKQYEIDMTHGPLVGPMIRFALPLMLTGILQLLFNACDMVVVGRFTGKTALAAVGSTNALINIFTTLFIGISLGVNVMVARYYAAGKKEDVAETVHTAVLTAALSGILVMILGILFGGICLGWMGTPDDVIGQATLYIRIYFMGMPFFMLYNYGAAILKAVGDTRRPLYYLLFAGALNVALNLLLVCVFKLGVAGVAIATIFSQFISCVLVLRCLVTTRDCYRVEIKKLHINVPIMLETFRIGIPSGIQSMVVNFSNTLLQSSVNSFDSTAMAGYTAANSMLGFCYVSIDSVAQCSMSFTSQNLGVGDKKRLDKVLKNGFILETIVGLTVGIGIYLLGTPILHIYSSDEDVIARGLEIIAITTIPYVLCGYMNLLPGIMRGMSYAAVPMVLSVIGTVGVRIFWIYAMFPSHRSLFYLFISYPASWIVTVLMQIICYLFVRKKVYASLGERKAE